MPEKKEGNTSGKTKNKFLFYYGGNAVYEGDERHKILERCRIEFGGDMMKMAKHDLEQINKLL